FAERPRRRSDTTHISVLETASTAGDESSDADVASLACLSITQQSPSEVSSVNLYYGAGDDDRRNALVDHSNEQRASSASAHRRRHSTQHPRDDHSQLFKRERLGIVISVAAVGVVHGLVQSAAYPFFKLYLNADEYQAYAAERWLALPWLLKPALALLTDAVPIRGRRRQAYLLIGWAWCLLFALVTALLPSEEPYARDGRLLFVEEAAELRVLTTKDEHSELPHALAAVGVLWRYAQKRAVWQAAAFVFVSRVGFSYYATSVKAVYEFWEHVSPLESGVFSSVNCGAYAGVALLFACSQHALSWRKVVVGAAGGSAFVALMSALFTVFGVVRSAFLTLTFEQLGSAFDALAYFVALFLAVHVAEPGVETMLCVVVALLVKLASLLALPLLPHSAQQACEVKGAGGAKRLPAIVASAIAGFLLFWAVLMVLLASFERTACLTVAGGEGC
ncbi:hypothetical protein PybrP1_004515, partial [[Pythium] brassicae (nom. inval.)]